MDQPAAPAMEVVSQQLSENNANIMALQAQIVQATVQFQEELQEYQKRDTELRAAIVEGMEQSGTKSFENDFVKLTYIAPTQRVGVDLDRMKFEHPELAEKYKKITPVKSSVRIKVK